MGGIHLTVPRLESGSGGLGFGWYEGCFSLCVSKFPCSNRKNAPTTSNHADMTPSKMDAL